MTGFCEHGHETSGFVKEGQFLRNWTTFQGRLFSVKFRKIRVYGPKFQEQSVIETCVTHVTQHHVAVYYISDLTCTKQRAAADTCWAGPRKPAAKYLRKRNITSLQKLRKAEFN